MDDLIFDSIRGAKLEAYLEKKIRSNKLKSQATNQLSTGQLGGENVPEIEAQRNMQLELLRESTRCRARELGIDISEKALSERARI